MSIFNAYDAEFSSITKDVNKNIQELKELDYTEEEKVSGLVRLIEGLLSQTNDLVKQMEVEVRGQDPATKKVLLEKVGQYKKTVSSLKNDFERAKEKAERSALIGDKSNDHRQRLLDNNKKLDRQRDVIGNAIRTVHETEEVGLEITSELQRNREKIESARSKAQEFSGITDNARRILSSMSKRDVQQRFLLLFVAAVLIVAIIITIYFSVKK